MKESSRNSIVNVVVSCNENYIFPTQVMLDSLYFHNRYNQIIVHFVYSNVREESITKLSNQIHGFGWKFYPIRIPTHIESLVETFPTLEHFTKDMYYRLFLPWLLPECEKVIYLDSDTMIRSSFNELYHHYNCKEDFIVAVPEMDLRCRCEGRIRLGLEGCEYFNSGVQLIFLDRIRTSFHIEVFTNQLISIINKHEILCPDQDLMNVIYKGKITTASKFWNYGATNSIIYKLIHIKELKHARIVHFTRSRKPWMKNYVLFYSFEYWKYLRKYLTIKEKIIYWLCKPTELFKFCRLMVLSKINS